MARSRAIANLAVVISARTKKFERGFARANKRLKKFGRSILSVTAGIRRFGSLLLGAIGIGSIAAFTASIIKSVEALDKIAKTADKLGIVPKELIAFQLAAKKAGIQTRTFNMALQRMIRRVSEAAVGTGEAQAAIKELGLDATVLGRMSPDKQLRALSKAIQRVGWQADRVRQSFKLFDSEGVAMVNLMMAGAKAFDDAAVKIKRFGLDFNRIDLAKIEAFNDAMTDLKLALTGIRHGLAVKLSIPLTLITERLTDLIVKGADFGNIMVEGFVKAAGAAGKLLDVMRAIEKLHLETRLRVVAAAHGAELKALKAQGGIGDFLAGITAKTFGIPFAPKQRGEPTSFVLQGLEEELAGLENKLSALGELPKAMHDWEKWVRDLIAVFRIDVRKREEEIRAARYGVGGVIGRLYKTLLPGILEGLRMPIVKAAAAIAGPNAATQRFNAQQARIAKEQSPYVPIRKGARTFSGQRPGDFVEGFGMVRRRQQGQPIPVGVGAASKAQKQGVADEKTHTLLQQLIEWVKTNPIQAAGLGFATVK